MTQPLRMLNTWDTTTLQRQYFHFFKINLFDIIVFLSALLSRGPAQGDAQSWPVCARRERIVQSCRRCQTWIFCRHPTWIYVVSSDFGFLLLSSNLLKSNLFLKGDSYGWKGLKSCKELRNEIEVMNYFASKDYYSSKIKRQSLYRKVQSAIFHQPYRIQKQLDTHTGSHISG